MKKDVGRPAALNQEESIEVQNFVLERWEGNLHSTIDDTMNSLSDSGVHILPDTLRKHIREDRNLKMMRGHPMEQKQKQEQEQEQKQEQEQEQEQKQKQKQEQERILCPHEQIVDYLHFLRKTIKGTPAILLFNLDERGFQE
jgi:hypothetical protein